MWPVFLFRLHEGVTLFLTPGPCDKVRPSGQPSLHLLPPSGETILCISLLPCPGAGLWTHSSGKEKVLYLCVTHFNNILLTCSV